MAAPQDAPEQAFRLRQFQGVNTTIDSTFLGPSFLQLSQNWFPAVSFRLAKRPGNVLFQHIGNSTTAVTDLLADSLAGITYLYAYCQRASDAVIAVSINEGPFGFNPPNVTFPTATARGRLVRFRDRVYAGNGVDPLVSWKVTDPAGTPAQVYGAMGALSPGGTASAQNNPTGTNLNAMPTGTYQVCFAVYDTVTKFYVSRGDPIVDATNGQPGIVIGTGTNNTGQSLLCHSPTAALAANQVYRCFIAYRGFPIEYATAQGTDWKADEQRTFTSIDVTDLRCPIKAGVTRTGNMFLVWRNRVIFAGSQAEPFAVFATDTILPGLEQDIYNQGTFFPVAAKVMLPDTVTGIGMAGATTDLDPTAPLLFFTQTRTFLCQDDPFDPNGSAVLLEIASRVGCVAHDTIVTTPLGTIFAGIDSIYLIPPGGGYPQDIGWPIASEIRQLDPGTRSEMNAIFHKQFYKIALPPGFGEWWLDLRQGLGSVPQWWGPMLTQNIQPCCHTAELNSQNEIDRGYAAYNGTDIVVLLHQLGIYTDYDPSVPTMNLRGISSVIKSGRFDAEQPFVAKVFTRLRLICETAGESSMQVLFETDGGSTWPIEDILLGEGMHTLGLFRHTVAADPPGPAPEESWVDTTYNPIGAQFGTIAPTEAQTITPAVRPRGLSIVVTLSHSPEPTAASMNLPNVELRDFELLFLPVGRKVRYLGESTGK